jgi:hypothetical protein
LSHGVDRQWVGNAKDRLAGDSEGEKKTYKCYLQGKYSNAEIARRPNRQAYGLLTPEWNLEDISGRRILIVGENGVGDEILTASCLHEFLQQAKPDRSIWQCDAKLQTLFTRSFPEVEFRPMNVPAVDATIYSWELIRRVRKNLDDFAWTQSDQTFNPYLKQSPSLSQSLRRQYSDGRRPIVGLAWRSTRDGVLQSDKSCGLRDVPHWKRFFENLRDRVRFVSLQYGDTRDDIAFVRGQYEVEIYQDDRVDAFNDLDAAAAQIAAMDYAVTISTTTAHVAGALGVPTWAILTRKPFPHWGAGKTICPWYPTICPVRQQSPGGWKSVLEHITDNIAEEISSS